MQPDPARPASPGTGRLFAALWPDDATRAALVAWQARTVHGDRARPVPACDLHATLVFIGDQPADQLPAIADAVDLAGPRQPWVLDGVERWRDGLTVAVASAPPAALLDWQAALADRLRGAGVAVDPRPYRLHVTLARDAGPVPEGPPPPPQVWRPAGHVLAVRDGPHYRLLRHYP